MYFRFTGDSIVSTLCLLLWQMFRSLETLFNDHCRCIFFISRCDLILNWDSFHLYQSFLNAEELSLDRLTGGPSHSIRVRESTAIYRLGCNKKKKKNHLFWRSTCFGNLGNYASSSEDQHCSQAAVLVCHTSVTHSWEGKDLPPTTQECASFGC